MIDTGSTIMFYTHISILWCYLLHVIIFLTSVWMKSRSVFLTSGLHADVDIESRV